MHTFYRLTIIATILLASVFGCKSGSPRYQKGGTTVQSFPATVATALAPAAPVEGQSQSLAQPENAQGNSKQDMTEEKTVVHPDGTVEQTRRTAGTVIGGSQSLTDILKVYGESKYFQRLALAVMLGMAAWYFRIEWPVVASALALGAILTAFFGPIASAIAAAVCAGLFIAYHVLKAQIPISRA
jgi:hypothetical protein